MDLTRRGDLSNKWPPKPHKVPRDLSMLQGADLTDVIGESDNCAQPVPAYKGCAAEDPRDLPINPRMVKSPSVCKDTSATCVWGGDEGR